MKQILIKNANKLKAIGIKIPKRKLLANGRYVQIKSKRKLTSKKSNNKKRRLYSQDHG